MELRSDRDAEYSQGRRLIQSHMNFSRMFFFRTAYFSDKTLNRGRRLRSCTAMWTVSPRAVTLCVTLSSQDFAGRSGRKRRLSTRISMRRKPPVTIAHRTFRSLGVDCFACRTSASIKSRMIGKSYGMTEETSVRDTFLALKLVC